MRCPDCGAEMRPLAMSVYCPNDCDRKVADEIDPEKTPRIVIDDDKFEGTLSENWKQDFVGPLSTDDDEWLRFLDDLGDP